MHERICKSLERIISRRFDKNVRVRMVEKSKNIQR